MEGNNLKHQDPPKIRVVVRKRPQTQKEVQKKDQDILEVRTESTIVVKELKNKVDLTKYIEEHSFTFDNTFDDTADNHQIYQQCVQPLVHCTFQGSKTTCFAYGQTGSGKTYTMMGKTDCSVPGLYLLAAYDIINLLKNYPELELQVSFYEIYCGKLFDLLNQREQVHCREDHKQKVNIVGLMEQKVRSVQEIMQVMMSGLQSRSCGQTGANEESSRSHAILQLQLKKNNKLFGKMSFIDLAGSERGADTMDNNKQTRMDGAEINKSLLALKECIRALDLEKKHLPFRGSKLTQVLKDSFTGNSKTTMIANVSPTNSCCEHTLNTLRYADRVKDLKKEQQLQCQNQYMKPINTKDDQLSKQLMLARQSANVTKISLNQNTLQPKNQNINNNFNNNLQSLQKKNTGFLQTSSTQSSTGQQQIKKQNQIQRQMTYEARPQTAQHKANQQQMENIQMKITDMPQASFQQLEVQYGEDVNKICTDHEKLVEMILEEEEDLINGHRQHIDDVVDLVKQEMMLLHEVDKPGSDIEEYISSLDAILLHKMELISVVRSRLINFFGHIKLEENLQKLYQTKQSQMEGDNNLLIDDEYDYQMEDEYDENQAFEQ